MKKIKRLVAVICSTAMLFSTMSMFTNGVHAEDAEVVRTKTTTLVDNDFSESDQTIVTRLNGATGGSATVSDGKLVVTPEWGVWALKFNEGTSIALADSSEYHINFDMTTDGAYNDTPSITLTNHSYAGTNGVAVSTHFPLFTKLNSTTNPIKIGNRSIPSGWINYTEKTWYNFDIKLRKGGTAGWTYDLKFTDANGTLLKEVTNQDGWSLSSYNNGQDIDALGFYGAGTVYLDNLLIEKVVSDTTIPEDVEGWKTIFNLDYDVINQNIVNVGGGSSSKVVIEKDSTGNKYAKIEDNWNVIGYKFNNGAIDVEDYNSTYKISYDFKLGVKNDYATWGNIALSNRTHNTNNKGIGAAYPLLRACSETACANQFAVFGRVIPGAIYNENSWYSFDLEFKASEDHTKWEYDLTITDKANSEAVASLCTYDGANGGGVAIPEIGDIDMFVFGAGGITSLDNILVQSYTPEISEDEPSDSNSGVIYSNDFVSGSDTPARWNSVTGGTASTTNGYLEISPLYGIYGYEFGDGKKISLSDDTSVYKINFDMKSTGTDSGTVMVALTDKTFITTPGNGIGKTFPLMTRLAGEAGTAPTIKIGTRNMPARLAYAENTWYNFDISIKKVSDTSWDYDITMTDGQGNAQTFGDADWNLAGFNGGGDITAIVFAGANSICMDNLRIEKVTYPAVKRVIFKDAEGNELSYSDTTLKTIDLVFSEAMNADSLASAVTLTDSQTNAVGFTPSLSDDKLTYTLIPADGALVTGKTYIITVSNAAMSDGGNAMQGPYSKSFTVLAPSFTAELKDITIGTTKVENLAGLADGAANVNISVSNTTASLGNAEIIVAYYNTSDQLADVDIYPVSVDPGTISDISKPITIAKPANTKAVKVMLWNSITGLYPLSANLTY